MTRSRDATHFADLYRNNADPWGFTTDPYEQAKYRHSIDILGGQRFAAGFEIGCSIGVLTQQLAPHCDTLLAVDIVDQPLQAARLRCAEQPWVSFQRMQVPNQWPIAEKFDLILLSEVLYFLTQADIDQCAARVMASLLPGANVLLVNWLGRSDDPCSGDEATERFISATADALTVAHRDRQPRYRLDLLVVP